MRLGEDVEKAIAVPFSIRIRAAALQLLLPAATNFLL
jgi:hypothetical protein